MQRIREKFFKRRKGEGIYLRQRTGLRNGNRAGMGTYSPSPHLPQGKRILSPSQFPVNVTVKHIQFSILKFLKKLANSNPTTTINWNPKFLTLICINLHKILKDIRNAKYKLQSLYSKVFIQIEEQNTKYSVPIYIQRQYK